ncbi:CocE/NonD family hydrolase [Roseateles sp.]|uniref:CocE/NonD family hydrolase n=1 Tax=Roseateles sp. TaxID=1971397 RepID=UPI0025D39E5E|nr:CocE/NonD family hydrolase [Roseateles sp.]MBV8037771.1 CocE/NonD family hydrolase [Roseateles sp.]
MTDHPLPAAPDHGPYDVDCVEHMVPMRDGVRLATDIYRPALNGVLLTQALPVLMERSPYNKRGSNAADRSVANPSGLSKPEIARYFASHGYVVVLQDCRGRYGSEGVFRKYLDEAEDGVDTLAWLRDQPFCDGRIATWGLSYCAHTQSALGALNPDGLAAQWMDSGGFASAFHAGIRQGGAFELKQVTWALKHARLSPSTQEDPARAAALASVDIREWLTRLPWWPGHSPVTAAPEYEAYLFEQWRHGSFDDYWRRPALWAAGHYPGYADVPTVHMSSWYDPYASTAISNYLGLSRFKQCRPSLIMGPWVHGRRSQTFSGDVDFGPQSTLDGNLAKDYLTLRREWFDHALGRAAADGSVPPDPLSGRRVAVFIMGGGSGRKLPSGRMDHGGRWHFADAWPLPGSQNLELFLHADGRLAADAPTADAASLSYDYDPRHPVPTMGGTITSAEPVMVGGGFDQRDDPRFFGCKGSGRDLAERADVLSFVSAPLAGPLDLVGEVKVTLFVSSDAVDTDFTAKLIDWYPPTPDYPDGFALNITDGILRMRYRDSWEQPSLMEPGKVFEATVQPFPSANRFCAGHRLRIDISSSNFPHFDPNPNTGAPEGDWRESRVARNTLHLGAHTPSRVSICVLNVDAARRAWPG